MLRLSLLSFLFVYLAAGSIAHGAAISGPQFGPMTLPGISATTLPKITNPSLTKIGPGDLAGPIIVGNGAGGSEYALVLTSVNLGTLASNCISDCQLSTMQQAVLAQVIERAKTMPFAKFVVADQASWIFRWVDAKTVEFNQASLWQDREATVPYDLAFATATWLQVLAQLPAPLPAADVQVISAALVNKLRAQLLSASWTHVGAADARDRYEADTVRGATGSTQVIVHDESGRMLDLTAASLAAASTQCDAPTTASEFNVLSLRLTGIDLNDGLKVSVDLLARWRCGSDVITARILHEMPTIRESATGHLLLDVLSLQSFVTGQ